MQNMTLTEGTALTKPWERRLLMWVLMAVVLEGIHLSYHANHMGFCLASFKHPQEKGKATHSSILAWRLPWTEEPGGLQCMGSQRVRHD